MYAFIVSYLVLHCQLAQLSHLEEQGLDLIQFDCREGGAAAALDSEGRILHFHEYFLDLISQNLVLLHKLYHPADTIQFFSQFIFFSGIIRSYFIKLFFSKRRIKVQVEHHILKTCLPPGLGVCQPSVLALFHGHILTSTMGISAMAFCISSSSTRLSNVYPAGAHGLTVMAAISMFFSTLSLKPFFL